MSNVVSFPTPEIRDGEIAFMLCPCTEEGVPFAVGVVVDDQPFIAHLICPECETVVPVNNGYIMNDENDGF